MSRAAVPRPSPAENLAGGVSAYFHRSELPWHSLLFLMPLIVLYELGTRQFAVHAIETRITAFSWMSDFFGLFGASGRYLPALAVVGVLLSWHIARKDPWEIHVPTLAGMMIESFMLVIPLVLIGGLFRYYLPVMAVEQWRLDIISSLGAGVYEEMLFRLGCFTVLHLFLIDFLRIPLKAGTLLVVVVSAVLFSAYHYWESEPFQLRSFVFRTAAGIYFGAVFLCRGFGVTAGTHACYDVVVVTLRFLAR